MSPNDFAQVAQCFLSSHLFAYYSCGAGDELTLRDNAAAFERRSFWPKALMERRWTPPALDTTLLGKPVAMPLGIAPMALQGLAHPEAERLGARAASEARTIYCLSTFSNAPIEEVAAEHPDETCWFQLYLLRDRGLTSDLINRAKYAGCGAIVVTVDLSVPGHRDREARHELLVSPSSLANLALDGPPAEWRSLVADLVAPAISWRDIEWVTSEAAPMPVVVKGLLRPIDATRARDVGAAAVVVSNHGGRQLDRTVASLDCLEPIAQAVGSDIEIYLDSGVRRGSDITMALCLGARAAFIGRPYLYAVSCGGLPAARRLLDILRRELEVTLQLLGADSTESLTRDLVI